MMLKSLLSKSLVASSRDVVTLAMSTLKGTSRTRLLKKQFGAKTFTKRFVNGVDIAIQFPNLTSMSKDEILRLVRFLTYIRDHPDLFFPNRTWCVSECEFINCWKKFDGIGISNEEDLYDTFIINHPSFVKVVTDDHGRREFYFSASYINDAIKGLN